MWILPQLVPGIATYLTVRRLHVLMTELADDDSGEIQISITDVKDYLKEVKEFREGLKVVYDTAEHFVTEKRPLLDYRKRFKKKSSKGWSENPCTALKT